MYRQRLAALRQALAERKIDAFLLPRSDQYLNEDLAPADERLHWLSGFSGSQGLAVVTASDAALLVDGRYTVQAACECGDWLEVLDLDDGVLFDWLAQRLPAGANLAGDARLHSVAEWQGWQAAAERLGLHLIAVDGNPIDACWLDRPAASASAVSAQPLCWAGEAASEKLARLTAVLREHDCDALWLPAPDMVAWLLNVRGKDIAIAPLPFSSAMLYGDGGLDWFIDAGRLQLPDDWLPPQVRICPPEAASGLVGRLAQHACRRLWVDPQSCNADTMAQLRAASLDLYQEANPLLLMRACKNAAELEGSREAHRIDGLALCRFLHEFEAYPQRFVGEDELAVSAALADWRGRHADYRGVSFDTIAACAANGAQPHYLPKPGQAGRLERGELLLIDSGGQYPQGTTDVTRVLPLGPATVGQRALYTQVLRAHIALASCRFPGGTSGQQLDIIARRMMWQSGLDYGHGTGHGVGSYLQVHEGPHRIARHASPVPLRPGMITSIEPGVYLPGELGIRIENLYEVVACERHPGFLLFRALTLVPLEPTLIDRSQLSSEERSWLDDYQARVRDTLAPLLEPAVANWLRRKTAGAEQSAALR